MKKIGYVSDIDILRGISILLVFFYHLKISYSKTYLFPGGYLGVDIFFVISGYLITSILHLNFKENKFSFREFFLRRFLRIVPVYIFVILLTLIIGYFVLIPNQLVDLSKSSISSTFFYSNIFFWKHLNNYYNPDAILNPLLHTWSLAIEIQFYIFFTLFFFILKKYFNNLKIILFLSGFASLIIAIIFSYYEPRINFFGFQSRYWEFILGSFIFFYKDKIKLKLNKIEKYGIYLLIFLFAVHFNENTKHPSFYTLFFLIFVSLLILNIEKQKISIFEKPLKFFGLLSYSLYIWHYPILSFSERIFLNENIFFKIYLSVFIIIISYFSYFILEKKLKQNIRASFYFVVTCFLFSLILIFFNIKNNGFEDRLKMSEFYKNSQKDISIPISENFKTFQSKSKQNILIIGNSHSIQTYQGFISNKKKYDKFNFKNFHIQIECFDQSILTSRKDPCKGNLDFKEKKNFSRGLVNFKNSNVIILSTRWTERDLKKLPEVINFLKKNNKEIIIFNSIIDMSNKNLEMESLNKLTLVQQNYVKKLFPFQKYVYLNSTFPSSEVSQIIEQEYYLSLSAQRKLINDQLKTISLENNVIFFDLNSYICDNKIKRCTIKTNTNKHIVYDSTGHLTMNGTKFLYEIISYDIIKLFRKLIFNQK